MMCRCLFSLYCTVISWFTALGRVQTIASFADWVRLQRKRNQLTKSLGIHSNEKENRISPSLSFLLILVLPPAYYGWSNWPNYHSVFFPTVHGFILTLEANQYRWPLELGLWEGKHKNRGEKAKLLKGEENSSYQGLAIVVWLTGNFFPSLFFFLKQTRESFQCSTTA